MLFLSFSYLLEQHGDFGPAAGEAPREKGKERLIAIEDEAATGVDGCVITSAARRRSGPASATQRRRGQGESLAARCLHFLC